MSDDAVHSKSELSVKTNVNDAEDMELDDLDNTAEKNPHDDEDAEEGEISDSKEDDDNNDLSTHYENRAPGFLTGIDFFEKEEQSKLEERAKRFGLDQVKRLPTELELKDLYESLNMKLSEGLEKSYRLNALHMRGTENLSTQDIFAYFKDYSPSFIEWISDYACNVVWLEEPSAASALIGLSQPISGLEAYHAKANPFHKKSDGEEEDSKDEDSKDASEGKEELVVVVAEIEGEGGENDIMVVDEQKENISNTHKFSNTMTKAVKASDIKIPIPPGRWRKGTDHPKAKCILLRFSTRSDKKFPHIENLSEYYKKHGNPNYGGMKGIITASRKRRYERVSEFPAKVFDDDVGDERDFVDSQCDDNKNPWGSLAHSWNRLDKTRGKQPDLYEDNHSPSTLSSRKEMVPSRKEVVPTPASRRETRHLHHNSSRPVFQRLGNVTPKQVQNSESEASGSSDSDDDQWTRRSKVPRMRMYADEEEDRLEQRKMLVNLKVSSQRSQSPEDLRSRLERDGRARSKGQDNAARNLPSVWSRLRPVEDARPTRSDDYEQSLSSSSSDSDSGSGSATVSDSKSDSEADGDIHKTSKSKKSVVDLRSKLDMKKSLRQPVSIRQKSPLRIEIDNDEYYRLIGSD